MKNILTFLLLVFSFISYGQTLRMPYVSTLQTYAGDTLKTSVSGDTVKFYTNQSAIIFNKLLKVNKDTLATNLYMRNYVSTHSAGGASYNVTTVTENTILSTTYNVILCNASSSAFTITLPLAINNTIYTIKKIDSSGNGVTINTTSSQTIDGYTSIDITDQYGNYTLISDGLNWFIISNL